MPLPALVLWLMIYPLAIAFGALAAVTVYWIARPRDTKRLNLNEVMVEGWRLYALLAAVPAFLLGAELGLWGYMFGYRAPLALTGLAGRLGLTLVVLSGVPVVAAACRRERPSRRASALAVTLLIVGVGLWGAGRWARARAWAALADSATRDQVALHQLVSLKAYRYLTSREAEGALDLALDQPAEVLSLVASARDDRDPILDRDLERYLADRLDRALEGTDPSSPTPLGLAAVPAMWWLTADSQRTLRAYALAGSELRAPMPSAAPVDFQAVAIHALGAAPADVQGSILEAIRDPAGQVPLNEPLITALAAHLGDPEPVGGLAFGLLLRDGSSTALRPTLPRFAQPDDPAWAILRADCPRRTQGLVTLAADADPNVAAGARAVLGYVRQYCRASRPAGG